MVKTTRIRKTRSRSRPTRLPEPQTLRVYTHLSLTFQTFRWLKIQLMPLHLYCRSSKNLLGLLPFLWRRRPPPRLQHPSETVSTNNSSSDSTSLEHFQDNEILNVNLSALAKEIHMNTAGNEWTEEEFTMIQESSETQLSTWRGNERPGISCWQLLHYKGSDKLKSLVTEKKLLPRSHIMAPLLVHELKPGLFKEKKLQYLTNDWIYLSNGKWKK